MPATSEFEHNVTQALVALQRRVETLSESQLAAERVRNLERETRKQKRKVATVRMPPGLYSEIQAEAKSKQISMNTLLLMKIARPWSEDRLPE